MNINFLFWNLNKQDQSFQSQLLEVAVEKNIDVVILAENSQISSLAGYDRVPLIMQNKARRWIQVFYKTGAEYKITHHTEYTELEEREGDREPVTVNRIQIFKISGNIADTFFAGVHFPSKLYHDEVTHLQLVPTYKNKVHNGADNSDRVFIVGDFNMNPFDLGMVEPAGFFACHNREMVSTNPIKRLGAKRIQYYNPCWSLLGDFVNNRSFANSKRTGGTHYHGKQKSRNLYWHLVDQLIMRKALVDEFVTESLEIIERDDWPEKMRKDDKNPGFTLDHLPLALSYNLQQS